MENEGEREKGEANNFAVSFSALHKDVANVLDFMERLKNEEDQRAVAVNIIERLKLELPFICMSIQLPYSDLEHFKEIMTVKRLVVEDLLRSILCDAEPNVGIKCDIHHILTRLRDNIDYFISLQHRSKASATMTEEQLNFFLLNLHHLSELCAEQVFPLVTQYEIIQKVCGNMRDFHGLIVNGCIEHKIVEYVLPQLQPMAESIGRFLWDDRINGDSRLSKLAHLLMKIIPIELEVMHICYTNLKASTSAEVRHFIKQLLETSADILTEYLIHLQEHMVIVIAPSTLGSRNIHVMIEFLLIILTDMPKDFIHHDKLCDLLARVGALTMEVTTLVRDLEEKLRNKESNNETNRARIDLLKNIERLKEDLKHVYLKAPCSSQCCFPMSDGPLFMHLLHIHLNDLLDSNAYSIALIKEEIGQTLRT